MADFARIANELSEILQSFDYTVEMYDENEQRTTEKDQARIFLDPKKNCMVTIKDNDDNSSVEFSYGPSTHASDVKGIITTLRNMTWKYAMTFSAEQAMKEIKPKASGAMTERKQDSRKMMNSLTEGMYGTSKSSYLRLEHARMIVRHSKRIDDSLIGARGRCVEQIFIENAAGERLLFASKQIPPARAMTQHVNHGGTFGDEIGECIMHMTEEYGHLGQASSFVGKHAANLTEGAMAVREACQTDMRNLRECFKRLAKPSTYQQEARDVIEQSKVLTETGTAIDETRINELRQLLNDADLPREVYECACRAMDRTRQETPVTEASKKASDADEWTPSPTKTVDVLGNFVDRDVWLRFERGKLDLKNPPRDDNFNPAFKSRYAEMCYKLGKVVPEVENDSLANLLQRVLSSLEDFGETGLRPNRVIPIGWRRRMKNRDKDSWKDYLKDLLKITKHALRAAGIPLTPDLAESNDVVKSHMDWLRSFDTDHVLSEDFGMGAVSPLDDMSISQTDQAKDEAVADFDAEDFANSPEINEMLQGRSENDPEEHHLTHDEVMLALRQYLDRNIQVNSSYFDGGFTEDTADVAEAVFDQAVEALQEKGFVVETNHNEESDDLAEGRLSIEDVLLPKPDQGDSLANQVTKKMVQDPTSKKLKKPDATYISQLTVLGNRTTGIDSQAY